MLAVAGVFFFTIFFFGGCDLEDDEPTPGVAPPLLVTAPFLIGFFFVDDEPLGKDDGAFDDLLATLLPLLAFGERLVCDGGGGGTVPFFFGFLVTGAFFFATMILG